MKKNLIALAVCLSGTTFAHGLQVYKEITYIHDPKINMEEYLPLIRKNAKFPIESCTNGYFFGSSPKESQTIGAICRALIYDKPYDVYVCTDKVFGRFAFEIINGDPDNEEKMLNLMHENCYDD